MLDRQNIQARLELSERTEVMLDSTRIAPVNIAPHPIEKELNSFLESWQAPKYLRPQHKKAIKWYYSVKQGRDGTRALCFMCNTDYGFKQLQIHHIDHNRQNNQLSNVTLACEGCNNEERKVWLSERSAAPNAAYNIGSQLNKEKDNEQAEKLLQEQLLKQAPTTFQKSVRYKQETLVYLVRHVKEQKPFDQAVADVEALTGCSHAKAIEYLNAFSMASFAVWRQWFSGEKGQFIAPRPGEAYEKAVKSVTEE